MKMTKKVLGVILALAMLVNVFAMFSFAAAPDSAIDLTMRVDKEYYSAGEVVTITVSEIVDPEVGDMRIGGGYAIGYDSSVISPMSTTGKNLATDQNFVALQDGFDNDVSGVNFTDDVVYMGDTIDDRDNWDSILLLICGDDGLTAFDATAGVDLFTFQMKIDDSAADGEYVIGFNEGSFFNMSGYVNDNIMGGVYGTDYHYYSTTDDYSFGSVTIKVGAPTPVGPKVAKSISQAKFTDDGTGNPNDDFLFRVKSVISESDWDTYFANTSVAGATTDCVTNVGIVAYKGTTGFDADTAKDLVINGTAAADYTSAETDYIQKTATDAYFGAIIELAHSTCDYDITYMGYVRYLDAAGYAQIIFYDAEAVAYTSTGYDAAVAIWRTL